MTANVEDLGITPLFLFVSRYDFPYAKYDTKTPRFKLGSSVHITSLFAEIQLPLLVVHTLSEISSLLPL